MLSPINKREPHLKEYRQKRARLIQAGIYLIEIDLVRRGQRPCHYPEIPDTPYLITSTVAKAPAVKLWPLTLQQKLPTIPIPLCSPDPDVSLDLAQVFDMAYEYAAYDLSIDYNDDPPPPKLSPSDLEWWQQHRQSFS